MTETAEEKAKRREQIVSRIKAYRGSFTQFARDCLRIRNKEAQIVPFVMNKAQEYVWSKLEEQKAKTGMVRALVLKGRQQGISTMTEARFYWKTTLNRNLVAYILAHEQMASDSLFSMVDRFQTNNPLGPKLGTSNAKELVFERLNSSYLVGTAGTKAGGRSRTAFLFHGSEVAFWPNAEEHFASSVQTVPNSPDTEIILESTANGASGSFYEKWQDAEAGRGDYIAIFVPWFWQDEYVREVDETFELEQAPDDSGVSEMEYATMYNLTNEQMAWRRAKIYELGEARFRQEYPATPNEAFISSSEESFIKPPDVMRARKRSDIEGYGPIIMGVDPAGAGGDRFAVAIRQGNRVDHVLWRDKVDTVEAAQWVRDLVAKYNPEVVNVDAGGIGGGVVSILRSWKDTAERTKAVNFGARSQFKTAKPKIPGPRNRRCEMWQRMGEWLKLEEGVSLPDIDALTSDMTAPKIKPQLNNDFDLESKKEMRNRGVRSPDLADAIALTFASLDFVPKETHKAVKYSGQEQPRDEVDRDPALTMGGGRINSPNGWMA